MLMQKGIQWTFFTTGHSLGGFLATVTAIEIGQEIEKCVPCNPPNLVLNSWRWYRDKQQELCAILRAALTCFLGSLTMLLRRCPCEPRSWEDAFTC